MVLAAGATADRISFGNTIKKERDVARAYALGIRLFAVDCQAEVEKIARAAPGSRVFCRILSDCIGAEWPLSRKFGCEPAMAVEVLEHALKLGLEPTACRSTSVRSSATSTLGTVRSPPPQRCSASAASAASTSRWSTSAAASRPST
jgi:hypothetical protein